MNKKQSRGKSCCNEKLNYSSRFTSISRTEEDSFLEARDRSSFHENNYALQMFRQETSKLRETRAWLANRRVQEI